MFPEYKQVTFEELESLVAEMKDLAKSKTFDAVKAAREAKADANVTTEDFESGLVRVRGDKSLETTEGYNRFIRFDVHFLQLCYYEMEVEIEGEQVRVGQMTLVDNFKLPLEEKLVEGFVDLFLNFRAGWRRMETPPHVAVVVQRVA